MKRGLMLALLVAPCLIVFAAFMSGCSGSSRDADSFIENRPGMNEREAKMESRVRALERQVSLQKQEQLAIRMAKETGLEVCSIPATQWSPGCLTWNKKGGKKFYAYCGDGIVETDL